MRVWMLARDAGTPSPTAVRVLRSLGYPVRSASTKVFVTPVERVALVSTIRQSY